MSQSAARSIFLKQEMTGMERERMEGIVDERGEGKRIGGSEGRVGVRSRRRIIKLDPVTMRMDGWMMMMWN